MAITTSVGLLSGCLIENDDDTKLASTEHYAVISTQSDDYSSGDISIISIGKSCEEDDENEELTQTAEKVKLAGAQTTFTNDSASEELYCVDNTNFSGTSDTIISSYEDTFFRIGRFGQNNITKLSIDSPTSDDLLWQFSTTGSGEPGSNPYKLVVKDDNTAYLIRYGQSTIWIIDPSVSSDATIEDFKIGEIDLSDYTQNEADTSPEAADALLIDDKLYVLMQNMDRDVPQYTPWIPGKAYIAIYDTENDNVEIETNDDTNTPAGIELIVENPSSMKYLSSNKSIYIAAVGSYVSPLGYTGGIEKVQLSDYSTSLIVDDGDATTHPYGQINNIAILNSTRGYFVGYKAWKDTSLYSFNPSTGIVDSTTLLTEKDISDIEISPLGNLWVTDRGESGIIIFNTVDQSVLKELISTELKPYDIEFVSRQSD